jgi:hypothetical protein
LPISAWAFPDLAASDQTKSPGCSGALIILRPKGVFGQMTRNIHVKIGIDPNDAISIQTPAVALCRKATTTAAKAKQTVIPTKIPPLGTIRSIAKITIAAINNKTAIASKDIDENFQKEQSGRQMKKGRPMDTIRPLAQRICFSRNSFALQVYTTKTRQQNNRAV